MTEQEQLEDYKRSFCDNGKRLTPKERDLRYVSAKTGKPVAYWSGLKDNQLKGIRYGKISQNN